MSRTRLEYLHQHDTLRVLQTHKQHGASRVPQAARYLARALNYTSNTTLRAYPTLKPTKPKPKITNLPYADAPYGRCPAYAGWTIPDGNDQDG